MDLPILTFFFFFFNDTATTEIYTLSLHDALPISYLVYPAALAVVRGDARLCSRQGRVDHLQQGPVEGSQRGLGGCIGDRKSTRLNSSHVRISYAVFCLKKKKARNGSHGGIVTRHA